MASFTASITEEIAYKKAIFHLNTHLSNSRNKMVDHDLQNNYQSMRFSKIAEFLVKKLESIYIRTCNIVFQSQFIQINPVSLVQYSNVLRRTNKRRAARLPAVLVTAVAVSDSDFYDCISTI